MSRALPPVLAWLAVALATPQAVAQPPAARPPPQAPADPAARRDWLRGELDALWAAPPLASAKVSLLVAEADTGKPLYAHDEKTGLNAASNVKLVTSAAALALLGPEYRWKTALYGAMRAPGQTGGRSVGAGGELAGDLFLKGTGDPTLSTQDLAVLASDLAALGVRRVRGGLVVDASTFDAVTVGPGFDQKNESAYFRAPSSAVSLNGNVVSVTIMPAAVPGAPARVVIEPASPYFVLGGRVTTAKDGPAAPAVETEDAGTGQTRITLSGRVRVGSEPRVLLRRVVHPELFAGHTLRLLLQKRGITIDKPLRVEAVPTEGFRPLATHDSPALAVVAHELNKRSSNFAAEQVVRTMGAELQGRPGTWDKGIEAVAGWLDSIGIKRGSYKMTNGSGLYDSNRFSAEQIVTVIRAAMRDFRIAGEYLASLAVAGADGTLAQRMGGTLAERYVRGKTGTLATASCLSGVVGAPGVKPLVFSILVNNVANPQDARVAQDRTAELLAAYLEPQKALPR